MLTYTLDGVCTTDALKVGEIRLVVPPGTTNTTFFQLTTSGSKIYFEDGLTVLKGATPMTSGDEAALTKTSYKVTNVSSQPKKLSIVGKNNISLFYNFVENTVADIMRIEDFAYISTSSNALSVKGDCDGNVESLKILNNLTTLELQECNSIVGNVGEAIQSMIGLTNANFKNCGNITGSIESIADGQISNGRVSGDLKIFVGGSNITYRGIRIANKFATITFGLNDYSVMLSDT